MSFNNGFQLVVRNVGVVASFSVILDFVEFIGKSGIIMFCVFKLVEIHGLIVERDSTPNAARFVLLLPDKHSFNYG